MRRRQSAVLVGLDPYADALWPVDPGPAGTPREQAGRAIAAHSRAVLHAVAPAVVGVKLQLACFERHGPPGWAALESAVRTARDLGLLVVADAKRGDIDRSARSYAEALLGSSPTPWGEVPGLGADAMTVAPYMGRDSIGPVMDVARPRGRGAFVLVRTSNPTAADLQDLADGDGRTVAGVVAGLVAAEAAEAAAPAPSDVGAVVGATAPERLAELRDAMPTAPFLLPGVGAQGGRVEDLAAAFAPGPGHGLVTASRSLVDAMRHAPDPPGAARAEAERLRAAVAGLG